jgi:hypothetical protein
LSRFAASEMDALLLPSNTPAVAHTELNNRDAGGPGVDGFCHQDQRANSAPTPIELSPLVTSQIPARPPYALPLMRPAADTNVLALITL